MLNLSSRLILPLLCAATIAVSPLVIAQGATDADQAPLDTKDLSKADLIKGTVYAPKVFRSAMNKVLPSVVSIETFGGVMTTPTVPPRGQRRPGPRQPSFRPGEGPTTGLIISSDGYIITSTFNFLKQPPIIAVVLPDGRRRVARLLGRDETRKLCVLKIDDVSDLPVPEFAKRDELRVGQWTMTIGVGYGGQEPAVSTGVLSALSRISRKAVQTDANISPANYGGPLLDIRGRVIGICVPMTPRGNQASAGTEWYDSGIGFAVPFDGRERLIEELKKGKIVQRGLIGFQPSRQADAKRRGVPIANVLKNTGAHKAGLRKGDVIVEINGQKTPNLIRLTVVLDGFAAGETVLVKFYRGETLREANVKLSTPEFAAQQSTTAGTGRAKPTTQPATQPDDTKVPATQPAG